MKKQWKAKLSLDRETLAALTLESLDAIAGGNAAGGATKQCTFISCPHGCSADPQTLIRC